MIAVVHRPTTVNELGYDRTVCSDCLTPWPCVEAVKEACERLDLAKGLDCSCGWHDEKAAQDLEQKKVMVLWTREPALSPAREDDRG